MEVIFWILGVLIVIGLIRESIKAINWARFLGFLIFGSVALAVLFSFTAEGVLVIVGAYAALLVISIFFGAFKNISNQ
jgi:uncharacterized membrane protein